MEIIFGALVGVMLVITLFALIILIGFAYLQVKLLEKMFPDYYESTLPSQAISEGDQFTADKPISEIPLDEFSPDFKQPLRVVFKDTPDGIEEVEERA